MDIEKWKIKRLIKKLRSLRGNGTSVITITIPANYSLNLIKQMLTDEVGTAVNIKSKVNRLSVLSAITSVQTKLKTYSNTPTNGLVLFCGEIATDEGKIKKIAIAFEPSKPLSRKMYVCDNCFHTESLEYLFTSSDNYGFIIIDGHGVLYATLHDNIKNIISHFKVLLPKKHNKGGQSAARYGRLRKEAIHNYIRKVAESARNCFITDDKVNVKGIIIAGSSELKMVLTRSSLFDKRLKKSVIKLVDVSYGGKNGFYQAIELVGDTIGSLRFVQETKIINKFFQEIKLNTGKFCFGVIDTMNALEQGAVSTLIINQDFNKLRVLVKFKNREEIHYLNNSYDQNEFKNSIEIKSELLLDWFVENYKSFGTTLEIISNSTSLGSQFCKGFGGLGGILRWQVDFSQIEEDNE